MAEDETRPKWWQQRRADPILSTVLESVFDTMLAMEEPLRQRWVAAIKAHQYELRSIEPDRDLDPMDESIPEERFTTKMQMYLTDDSEFSSILVPIPATKRRWRIRRKRR